MRPHPLTPSPSQGEGEIWVRRWDWAAILFLVVTTALRLSALSRLELAPDEAYYWDWSRHLALGYYDQGPMIAYLIRATTALFGTNEFGVRFGVLAASLGTLVCAYVLARRIFGPLAGFLTVVLLGLTPLMAVGSLIATYDPPLVFFWALAALFLERALFAPSARQQRAAWLWTGVATGLGFLSKHTMLLIIPCLLLFLALSPAHRRWLRRPEPYLAFLLTLLLYSGVFWWNAHHHWWTFQHLLFLTGKSSGTPLRRLGDFLGSQALLLGPALFLASLAACWAGLRTAWRARLSEHTAADKPLFLACLGLPVFLFFCLLALKAKVQGNWLPFAWITPTVLWSGWAAARIQNSRRAAWKIAGLAGLLAVTSGDLTVLMAFPTLRAEVGLRLPPDADPSNTTTGWRQLAAHVQQLRQEMQRQGHKVFLAGNGYQYCALLAFYLPDHPETHDLFLHFRLTMYAAHVDRLKALLGEDAIFVNDGQADDGDLRKIFTTVQWDPPFPIWRQPFYTEPIRTIYIARCYRYRRYTGLEWALGG
ncbi:MAG TPA: glycosyltransferase family 39 protein [Chthonomonadaceae bacterium]|nr:glycosyltransferase family 39 protein [Chthonomonadaceae bacterium]